jgi:hypothetical protein
MSNFIYRYAECRYADCHGAEKAPNLLYKWASCHYLYAISRLFGINISWSICLQGIGI